MDEYNTITLDFNNDGTKNNSYMQRSELLPETYGRDTFQLGCAQLCGSGHSTMNKGDMFIITPEEYQKWYFGHMWTQNNVDEEDGDDDWGDDW